MEDIENLFLLGGPVSADGLIEILLDKTAEHGEREAAALDLRLHPESDRALETLEKVGSDTNEDKLIASFCGESIGEILVERDECRRDIIESLVPAAKREAIGFIRTFKPEWITQYNLEELVK